MRLGVCAACGASITHGYSQQGHKPIMLELVGFGAMVFNDGTIRWGNQLRQHMCQPAAVEAMTAYIESVTTEEERERANMAAEQRELAREMSAKFDCPKPKCEAKVEEPCVNLTILNRTGERKPTAWPHAERMALAMKVVNGEITLNPGDTVSVAADPYDRSQL